MKKVLMSLVVGLVLVGCAKTERVVVQGTDGKDGKDGISCVASDEIVDGLKIGARVTCGDTFALVLNGKDGEAGQDAVSISGSVASATQCSTGGYVLTIGSTAYTVCNGAAGFTGEQGPVGPQGDQGPVGTSGVTSVLLCNNEYAFKVGNQLYAVFHQEMCEGGKKGDEAPCTSTNPNSKYSNTYLALLNPGPYVTTDGTNCSFTVNSNGTVTK